MANIRKLLLWKTSLKGISNTEGKPDVHVPPAPVPYIFSYTSLASDKTRNPTSYLSYDGSGYDTEGLDGYYFCVRGEASDSTVFAQTDPTYLIRNTFSDFEIKGKPCFDAQDKNPDPYPYKVSNSGGYTGTLENWEYSQPLSAPWVSSASESWGGLYREEYTESGVTYYVDMDLPSLYNSFFSAAYIQPRTEDEQSLRNMSTGFFPTADYPDQWSPSNGGGSGNVNYNSGYNWKYRWLQPDGTVGWTLPDGTVRSTGDIYRFTKTIPNTSGLAANYWIQSFKKDPEYRAWNEFEDNNNLTYATLTGYPLWNAGEDMSYLTNSSSGFGYVSAKQNSMNAGVSQLIEASGSALNIGFEIELALHRWGASVEGGYGVTGTTGNMDNLLAYRAGEFTFNHSDLISDSGSHIYIPCYVQFQRIDDGAGDIPSIFPGELARYVVVALPLRQKYNTQTIIHGAGVVLDPRARQAQRKYSIDNASGVTAGLPNNIARSWDAKTCWAGIPVLEEFNSANSLVAPVTCYRLSEDGRYQFISGGGLGLSTDTTHDRRQCITRFVSGVFGDSDVTNDRSTGFLGINTVFPTYRRQYDFWGRDPGQFVWNAAGNSTLERDYQVCYLPDCAIFPGYDTVNGNSRNSYSGYRINSFRWSNDGRFLYVMWDNAENQLDEYNPGYTPNELGKEVKSFVERYYCTDPLKYNITLVTGNDWYVGLMWCGTTDIYRQTADPSIAGGPELFFNYIYPPRSFEITPDGLYMQVLMDPFRQGKPFLSEHWLGGDDISASYNPVDGDDEWLASTAPEYALVNYDNSTSTWTRKIYWPINTTRPGGILPDPHNPYSSEYPNYSRDGFTKTYIVLGWAWASQNEYLDAPAQSRLNTYPTLRRDVNTYPCDFEWSVDGTMLYLFQRYRDSDYGSRRQGDDRGFMEMNQQPVILKVPTHSYFASSSVYGKYPYINPNYTSTESSRAYLFKYTHRIAGILRETKDRYINTYDTSDVAYTAYYPVNQYANRHSDAEDSHRDRTTLIHRITTQGSPFTHDALFVTSAAQLWDGVDYTATTLSQRIWNYDDIFCLNTSDWNYNDWPTTGNNRRWQTARDYIVLGRGDDRASGSEYFKYEYKLQFSDSDFSGQTIHLVDAAGNDLTGKTGVTVGGTPGTDYYIKLDIYEDSSAGANTLISDYNPIYVRVGSTTSDLGYKIYHETPRPEQMIMTPLASVDNMSPVKPGWQSGIRADFFSYYYTSATPLIDNNNGFRRQAPASYVLRTNSDSATYNMAKNGSYLNFIGTCLAQYWDYNDTIYNINESDLYNRRIFTYMIADDAEDTLAAFDANTNDYKSSAFAFALGVEHRSLSYSGSNPGAYDYEYFRGLGVSADWIMYGPHITENGTQWGNTVKLVENDGNMSMSIITQHGIALQSAAYTPYTFSIKRGLNSTSAYHDGFFEEESTVWNDFFADEKSYSTWDYNNMHWQGAVDSFQTTPAVLGSYWPVDVQTIGKEDNADRVSLSWDTRAGKEGLWFNFLETDTPNVFNWKMKNSPTYISGSYQTDQRSQSYYNVSLSLKTKTRVTSDLLNSTFIHSKWKDSQGNSHFNTPTWRYKRLPRYEDAKAESQWSGYMLSWMDIENTSGMSDHKNRVYSVKYKLFNNMNFHNNGYSYAQVPPATPADRWEGYSVTIERTGLQTYADIGSGLQLYSADLQDDPAERKLFSVRSIRYVDDGKKLAILGSGEIKTIGGTNYGVAGWVLFMYDLPTPYSLNGATFDKSYTYQFIPNGVFDQSWWTSYGANLHQLYGSDFVFKDDGTKVWVIGVASSAVDFRFRNTSIKTVLKEFSLSTAWDLSSISYANETVYDNLSYSQDFDYESPCDLEVSKDGNTVYWSTYGFTRYSVGSYNLNHWKSPLSQTWNLLSPTTTTTTSVTTPTGPATRVQVGERWYADQGAGAKVRFLNDERWYRTNFADEKHSTPNIPGMAYLTAQSFPMGGASSYDVDRSTQKVAGSFSFGNMGMFPYVERGGTALATSVSYKEGVRNSSVRNDIFSFDISPVENRAIICDGQITIYELKFNNDTNKFGR